jgi:NADH-quinone oxidoreductase subunit C
MADETTTDAPTDEKAAAATEEEVVETDEAREELLGRFTEILGDAVLESHIVPGKDLWIRVSTDAWRATGEAARNRLDAKYFGFISIIDWLPSPFGRSMDSEVDRQIANEPAFPHTGEASAESYETGFAGGETRFQIFARVAHIGDPNNTWGVTLKADLDDEAPEVESWTSIYAGADWHEREAWEMYGVNFVGHPGLRNMYLPSGFEGNPGRKDFPLVARQVKPWPGIVDVEPMPTDDEEDTTGDTGESADAAEGGES